MFETITQFDDDRESLIEFLTQVKQLLIEIAFEDYLGRQRWAQRNLMLVLTPDDRAVYAAALREFMDSEQFEGLVARVRELDRTAIVGGGLGGAQLFLKRHTVRTLESRFLANATAGAFRRLLAGVDILLDSILDGTPFGSALSELKDVAGLLPVQRPRYGI